MIDISVIVPVFNEEKSISPFLVRLLPVLESISKNYEVIFCLDPSSDNTKKVIHDNINKNNRISLINFSNRVGQANATFAGIEQSSGNYVVTIDVDLQDPPELIKEMYNKAQSGFDVVYSKRLSREGESKIKCLIADLGYAVMSFLSKGSIQKDCGDYRLISKKVVSNLKKLNERHLFLRGQIPLIGFKSTIVTYHRDSRYLGQGNYNRYWGSIKMGLDGIFCFSTKPLLLIFIAALCLFIPSTLWLLKNLLFSIWQTHTTTNQFMIAFFSWLTSLNLFALSLVAEYIGRIYGEVQKRPRYIIDNIETSYENKKHSNHLSTL